MSAFEVLMKAANLGVTLRLDGDQIRYRPKNAATPELIEAIRREKASIMLLLADIAKREATCQNSITPHSEHVNRDACNPDNCRCYRLFGYPVDCQGAPCRWTFPVESREAREKRIGRG
jgi:hypothetical protein